MIEGWTSFFIHAMIEIDRYQVTQTSFFITR
jgi:hypothetical protein